MVVPNNNLFFATKNDHFGVFWGYHHLRKHSYKDYMIIIQKSMILATYPGKIPQSSPNSHKEKNLIHNLLVKGPFSIFQGGPVGEIIRAISKGWRDNDFTCKSSIIFQAWQKLYRSCNFEELGCMK